MQRTAIESMNGCKIKSGEKRRQVYSRHPPPQEVNPLTDLPRTALDLPIALECPSVEHPAATAFRKLCRDKNLWVRCGGRKECRVSTYLSEQG